MLRRAQHERGLGPAAPFALSLSKGGGEGALPEVLPARSCFDGLGTNGVRGQSENYWGLGSAAPFALSLSKGEREGAVVDAMSIRSGVDSPHGLQGSLCFAFAAAIAAVSCFICARWRGPGL